MISVALADDHPRMLGALSQIIQQIQGYHVILKAVNGFDLLRQIQSSPEMPVIALIDLQMPIMDGLAVTNFISRCYPDIITLIISNHTHPGTVQEMIEAGAKGYLIKANVSALLLSEVFTTILSGEIFIDNCFGDKKIFHPASGLQEKKIDTLLPHITEKEKTFLQLAATAITYDQIADLMNVAKESVYNYQKALKEKLGISTRQEFILYAIQHQIAKVARYHHHFPEKRTYNH